jgi:hypothetical protein
MPANAGIQLMDRVRHSRENGIQVGGWTPVFTGVTKGLDSRFHGNDGRSEHR